MGTEQTDKGKMKTAFSKRVIGVVDGSFLTKDNVVDNLPFFLFLFGLSILYIGNSHYAEKNVIGIERLNHELKELRSEFISTRSELMFVSKQTEVAKAVAPMGIHESIVPPKKIVVKQKEKAES